MLVSVAGQPAGLWLSNLAQWGAEVAESPRDAVAHSMEAGPETSRPTPMQGEPL